LLQTTDKAVPADIGVWPSDPVLQKREPSACVI